MLANTITHAFSRHPDLKFELAISNNILINNNNNNNNSNNNNNNNNDNYNIYKYSDIYFQKLMLN
ncbi:uncharacterized protein ELE39_001759 [Cryptosporidium sp. chipmunk genotype I]|uniref:uncharacterized protein n=1 Tax=Cryptosporidium sp. chipmunk genotype I TaxID=1280935 RepID=UPI00351A66CF|nr:hypothetical protein ELE39_001759 [Cryptosporidium sp. chipmunk genotype I]